MRRKRQGEEGEGGKKRRWREREKEERTRGGETNWSTREGNDERERKGERARLFADAADSTTGGGGLTAPLHIHPRYIDLSPSSGHVASPRLTSPHLTTPLVWWTRAWTRSAAWRRRRRRVGAGRCWCPRFGEAGKLALLLLVVVMMMQSYKSSSFSLSLSLSDVRLYPMRARAQVHMNENCDVCTWEDDWVSIVGWVGVYILDVYRVHGFFDEFGIDSLFWLFCLLYLKKYFFFFIFASGSLPWFYAELFSLFHSSLQRQRMKEKFESDEFSAIRGLTFLRC